MSNENKWKRLFSNREWNKISIAAIILMLSLTLTYNNVDWITDSARRLTANIGEMFGGGIQPFSSYNSFMWDDLRDAIDNAPANTTEPYEIEIDASFTVSGAGDESAIVIPADRNIKLVSDGGSYTITQVVDGQRHFIVQGTLILGNGI